MLNSKHEEHHGMTLWLQDRFSTINILTRKLPGPRMAFFLRVCICKDQFVPYSIDYFLIKANAILFHPRKYQDKFSYL